MVSRFRLELLIVQAVGELNYYCNYGKKQTRFPLINMDVYLFFHRAEMYGPVVRINTLHIILFMVTCPEATKVKY